MTLAELLADAVRRLDRARIPHMVTQRGPARRVQGSVAELLGGSALRITGLVGLRRATSRNPDRSYMDFAPKNMESGWLRSSLSDG